MSVAPHSEAIPTTLRGKRAQPPANDEPPATLWEAFGLAQEKFGPIMKSKDGARGKYAPLDAVLEMAVPILNECGLLLTQPTFVEGETLFVRTTVVHKATGEKHESVYAAGALALQHQQLGAGVTYARRYSLLSILGVFPENEDDDGEKAGAAAAGGGARRPQVRNESTGRMVDPGSSHQLRKNGAWERFERTIRAFTDLDELESWWADADTQAEIDRQPKEWQVQAAEEYEKRQEALLNAGRP